MKVLHLITARAGSKGIPRKNLREIAGIPLVGFKAISARRSTYCSRLIISTDSLEIQEVGKRFGAEAPFTRPAHLATDTASSVDVMLHAMEYVESEGAERYDALMLLEPSSPFATHVDLDNAVELMKAKDANVVIGVRPVEVHSSKQGPIDREGHIRRPFDLTVPTDYRRQYDQQEYTLNGALYLLKWDFFKKRRRVMADPDTTYAYVMDRAYSVEIDAPVDLAWAQFLVEGGWVDLRYWKDEAHPPMGQGSEG